MSRSRSRLAADWFAKLRINAQTQEVEHSDVSDVKEEVDTEKADLSYVDNAIANATMADSDILSAVKRLDGSGSGLDADTVDGIQGSSFLRSDLDDNKAGDLIFNTNCGDSIVGKYDSTKYQGVFSMGTSYRLPKDGSSPSNLYGIAWTHTNIGGQSKSGLSHQALFMSGGVTQTAIGTGIWTTGDLTVNGGDIVLGGTGRIQGVDTVSSGTDAANKTYVDTKHQTSYATSTVGGSVKARISGSNLYITFNGNNA